MTTAFQTAFDYAETISIFKRKKVSQTQSRDGTVKTTNLGGQAWQFEVQMPSGPKWTVFRPLIEKMEALDRVTVGSVQINHPGQAWITKYQGDFTNTANIQVTFASGNTLTYSGGGGNTLSAGQYKFRAGDLIQLGTGAVYSVVDDVPYNSNTITVHRPVREPSDIYTIKVGQAVVWNVICTQFPNWTLSAYDQISWSGPFVFAEAL